MEHRRGAVGLLQHATCRAACQRPERPHQRPERPHQRSERPRADTQAELGELLELERDMQGARDSMRDELTAKMLAILNEKKRRIHEIDDAIERWTKEDEGNASGHERSPSEESDEEAAPEGPSGPPGVGVGSAAKRRECNEGGAGSVPAAGAPEPERRPAMEDGGASSRAVGGDISSADSVWDLL